MTKEEHAEAIMVSISSNVTQLMKLREHVDLDKLVEVIAELEKLSQ